MTRRGMETITCPACGTESEFTVYDSINVDLDPELKEALYTDKSPLIFTCPHCGEKMFVSYDFLYHDMNNRYMLWFVPSGKIPQSNSEFLKEFMDAKLGSKMNRMSQGYRYRYARNIEELLEKIIEMDSAYPDYAWEILKALSLMRIGSDLKDKDLPLDTFRFRLTDEGKILCSFPPGDDFLGVEVSTADLEQLTDSFKLNELTESDEYIQVDIEWAVKFLRSFE